MCSQLHWMQHMLNFIQHSKILFVNPYFLESRQQANAHSDLSIGLLFKFGMYEPLPSKQQQDSTAAQSTRPSIRRHVIYKDCDYAPSRPNQTMQSQITSSLFLQELMYYNVFYSCIFVYLYLACQVYRWLYMSVEFGVPVRFILLAIFVPLEYFRLLNGFTGNLKETFPEVLAFFLLTIFSLGDQLCCMCIVPTLPLEFSLLLYGIIMHGLELLVCLYSMRSLTQAQTALFFWRNSGSSKVNTHYRRKLT